VKASRYPSVVPQPDETGHRATLTQPSQGPVSRVEPKASEVHAQRKRAEMLVDVGSFVP